MSNEKEKSSNTAFIKLQTGNYRK